MKNQCGVYDALEHYLHLAGWGTMAYVHTQVAGALRILSETLIIEECYFYNNSNLKGGAIYFNKNDNYDIQYFFIKNNIFAFNEAGDNGAAIEFEKNLLKLIGNISNCYFYANLAWRIFFVLFNTFSCFLVGSITTEFNHPESKILISDNYFYNNLADMAAGINAVHLAGSIIVKNCVFEENSAMTQNHVLIGSGAAIEISGSAETIVISENNLYIFNEIEYAGKKI